MTPHIGGLDLSLTSTGIATIHGAQIAAAVFKSKLKGHDRLDDITNHVCGCFEGMDVVAVEGLAYGARGNAIFDIGGLWWHVTWALKRQGVPLVVIPPATLKKYATGKGNASKDMVLAAAVRRFPGDFTSNDAADALVLAAMTADHYGCPIAYMPKEQRAALDVVKWAQLEGFR